MLDRPKLVNVLLFMERVQVTGKEALAWAETYQAVCEEIQNIDSKVKEKVK